jgi:putative ATP-binding cassette transporter
LTGLYQPSEGNVSVDGKVIGGSDYQRYREMFGVVFSDFYLFRRLYGLQEPDPDLVEELLTMLQIREKTRLKDGAFTTLNLSSGQRKRLAYAVSRLSDRQVYVFDEFAADQDPGFRRYFYSELLPELKRQGKTVVAVTHDERWFEAGDRLVKLDYGTIATAGTVVGGQTGTA